MKKIFNNTNSSININLNKFRNNLDLGFILIPPDSTQFIFICGANTKDGEVSKRRQHLIKFIESNIPDTQCIIAEKIFEIFRIENNKDNILEIENEISIFTDYIIIILESPSAFTELGVFSSRDLREKLIIVNNSEFDSAKSFINLGPLKAIKDEVKSNRVISYNMSSDGIEKTDAIGGIYNQVYEVIQERKIHKNGKILKKEDINPALTTSKEALKFVHDIILIAGPIARSEIIEIMKILFNKNKYDKITHYIALLVAFDVIEKKGIYYKSKRNELYLRYIEKTDSLSAVFKKSYQKYSKERLYEL